MDHDSLIFFLKGRCDHLRMQSSFFEASAPRLLCIFASSLCPHVRGILYHSDIISLYGDLRDEYERNLVPVPKENEGIGTTLSSLLTVSPVIF